jgi:hypothetical protein
MVGRVALTFLVLSAWTVRCPAQNAATPTNAATGATENGRIVRDPTTGKTYYQQWINESVPSVRWENKQITTTVHETQWVNTVVPTTQTIYQPQTQQVPQAYWKGAWNPFQQPTLAYKYVPVTTWVPQTTKVNQIVPRQQVVPKQQTITVPQPVSETKTQQRLVQTEIPQPATSIATSYTSARTGYTANQPPALFNIPLLARQPFSPPTNYQASLAVPPRSNTSPGFATPTTTVASGWSRPAQVSQFAASPNTGLRPVSRMIESVLPQSNYSAPMRTATAQGGNWNVMQTGMHPTVLR